MGLSRAKFVEKRSCYNGHYNMFLAEAPAGRTEAKPVAKGRYYNDRYNGCWADGTIPVAFKVTEAQSPRKASSS